MVFLLDLFSPRTKGLVNVDEPAGVDKHGNPVIVAEPVADPEISNLGHGILSLLFVGLVVTYAVLALQWHWERPDVEVFMQEPASALKPLTLRVTLQCSNPPLCGAMQVLANYTAVANQNECTRQLSAAQQFVQHDFAASTIGPTPTVEIPLCALEDQIVNPQLRTALPLAGVQINFAAINPGHNKATDVWDPALRAAGTVTLSTTYNNSFTRVVSMDSWQVKTLLVGQSKSRLEETVTTQSAEAVAIQYEGGRANWRSTLLVQQIPFANVFIIQRPGDILAVLASIGGAFYLVASVLAVVAPVFMCCCPGPARQAAKAAELRKSERKYAEPVANEASTSSSEAAA